MLCGIPVTLQPQFVNDICIALAEMTDDVDEVSLVSNIVPNLILVAAAETPEIRIMRYIANHHSKFV